MKKLFKYILIALIWTGYAEYCNAQMFNIKQDRKPGTIEVGLIGGLNIADFTGRDVETSILGYKNQKRYTGNIGFYGTYHLNENIALQPEILYSFRGHKININSPQDMTFIYQLSYIHVPLMFKGFWNNRSQVTPYVMFGPSISFMVTDRYSVKSSQPSDNINGDLSKEGIRAASPILELNFGVGFIFNNIAFEGRYMDGISNVFKETDIKHRVFTFNISLPITFISL